MPEARCLSNRSCLLSRCSPSSPCSPHIWCSPRSPCSLYSQNSPGSAHSWYIWYIWCSPYSPHSSYCTIQYCIVRYKGNHISQLYIPACRTTDVGCKLPFRGACTHNFPVPPNVMSPRFTRSLSLHILNITEPYNSYGDTRKTTPRQGRVPTEPCSQHRAYTGTNVVGERVQQMVKIWGRAATSKTPESHIGESALPCRADGADPPGKKWSSSWRYTAKYSRGGRQVQGRADTKVYKMW